MGKTIPEVQFAEVPVRAPVPADAEVVDVGSAAEDQALEEVVKYVLSDCFFAVGQMIGMRMTVDYDAVVWWHDHFRTKFLAAIRRQGNRWLEDRDNVTAVGWMLAERAVRYAAGRDSINVGAARRAAADVERYCEIHAKRAARTSDGEVRSSPLLAGYWCVGRPY